MVPSGRTIPLPDVLFSNLPAICRPRCWIDHAHDVAAERIDTCFLVAFAVVVSAAAGATGSVAGPHPRRARVPVW